MSDSFSSPKSRAHGRLGKWTAKRSAALLTSVLVASSLSGCVVWKDDYDVMAAKYRNESAAHALAKDDLAKRSAEAMKLQAKVAALEASLADSHKRLDQNAESMAHAEYEYSKVEQQRTEATELVAQLRSEQERLASHLKAYANDRAELNAERERLTGELQEAELRVNALTVAQKRAQARLALVRDLSLKLQPEIERKQAELLFDGDVVVLRLDASKMFAGKGVTREGKRLLAAAGQALSEVGPAAGKAAGKAKPPTPPSKPAPDVPAVTASSKEPSPRLVLSQWEKGEKLRDSADRLKLAAYELAVAGVEPTRFAPERVLTTYQETIRAVLTKPAAESEASEGTPPAPPPNPPAPLIVPGQSLAVHLVPQ